MWPGFCYASYLVSYCSLYLSILPAFSLFDIPRMYQAWFFLRGFAVAVPSVLNTFPLNNHMAHSLTSFRSLLKSPLSHHYFIDFKGVMSSPSTPSHSLTTYSALYFFTALLIAWHSIIHLFVFCLPLPLEHLLHENKDCVGCSLLYPLVCRTLPSA